MLMMMVVEYLQVSERCAGVRACSVELALSRAVYGVDGLVALRFGLLERLWQAQLLLRLRLLLLVW